MIDLLWVGILWVPTHFLAILFMDLLGVMIHPPATPVGWEEWDWINAIQLPSALTLTAIDYWLGRLTP